MARSSRRILPRIPKYLLYALCIKLLLIQSIGRLMGLKENKREYEMDMAEMKGKLSRGEPLYGKSDLSPSVQESAARNSRNSVFFICKMLRSYNY